MRQFLNRGTGRNRRGGGGPRFREFNRRGLHRHHLVRARTPTSTTCAPARAPSAPASGRGVDFGIKSIYKAEYVDRVATGTSARGCGACVGGARSAPSAWTRRSGSAGGASRAECYGCGVCRHVCATEALLPGAPRPGAARWPGEVLKRPAGAMPDRGSHASTTRRVRRRRGRGPAGVRRAACGPASPAVFLMHETHRRRWSRTPATPGLAGHPAVGLPLHRAACKCVEACPQRGRITVQYVARREHRDDGTDRAARLLPRSSAARACWASRSSGSWPPRGSRCACWTCSRCPKLEALRPACRHDRRHPRPRRRAPGLRGRRDGVPDRGRGLGYPHPERGLRGGQRRGQPARGGGLPRAGHPPPGLHQHHGRGGRRPQAHRRRATSRCRTRHGCRATPTAAPRSSAEQLVLAANGPALATCALRPVGMYGPRDRYHLGNIVAMARRRECRCGSGDGSARFSHAYSENVAHAHVLAAEQLLRPGSTVAGQMLLHRRPQPGEQPVRLHGAVPRALGLPVPARSHPLPPGATGWRACRGDRGAPLQFQPLRRDPDLRGSHLRARQGRARAGLPSDRLARRMPSPDRLAGCGSAKPPGGPGSEAAQDGRADSA